MFKELNMMAPFFRKPSRELGVREFARLANLSPATASARLKRLEAAGLLKYRRERNLDLYSANLESPSYRDLKTYYNIGRLRESGLLEKLDEVYLKPTVILFGSAAKGIDTETSDFDLVVVSEVGRDFSGKKHYQTILGRELQIFPVKDLKGLRNKHLIDSVLNGIVLQGELKWT